MARDGTNRGGRRVRAGHKPDDLIDKIQKGTAAQVMNFAGTELEGANDYGAISDLPGADISCRFPAAKKSSTAAMNAVTGGGIRIWTRSSVRRTPPLFALPAVNGSPFTEMISESTAATIAISSTGLVTAQQ